MHVIVGPCRSPSLVSARPAARKLSRATPLCCQLGLIARFRPPRTPAGGPRSSKRCERLRRLAVGG
jgi:hypothetical protein